jgi:hypothetical protein
LAPPKSTALKLALRRLIFSKVAFYRLTSENTVADISDSLKCDPDTPLALTFIGSCMFGSFSGNELT